MLPRVASDIDVIYLFIQALDAKNQLYKPVLVVHHSLKTILSWGKGTLGLYVIYIYRDRYTLYGVLVIQLKLD